MTKDELIRLFTHKEFDREGNDDFGKILGLARYGSSGDTFQLDSGYTVKVLAFLSSGPSWRDETEAVFQLTGRSEDMCFSVTGNSDSWDSWGAPEYTSPWSIKLVQPVQKMVTVYKEVKDG